MSKARLVALAGAAAFTGVTPALARRAALAWAVDQYVPLLRRRGALVEVRPGIMHITAAYTKAGVLLDARERAPAVGEVEPNVCPRWEGQGRVCVCGG